MKQVLIVYSTLSPNFGRGGVDTVLINYLKIFSEFVKQGKMKVDLLLLREPTENDLKDIPENINIRFNSRPLSPAEIEFQIYCQMRLAGEVNEWEKDYFTSWDKHIHNFNHQRILSVLNQSAEGRKHYYDVIINFDEALDSFLCSYDISNEIAVVRWIHSTTYVEDWLNRQSYWAYLLNKHQVFVSLCPEMKSYYDDVFHKMNINNKTHLTLFNPIDTPRVIEKANSTEISEVDQALLKEDYIVQVGRLFDYKNHDAMIDIYHQLKQKGIKQKLYIIGNGPNYAKLQEKINALGLQHDCLLLGQKDNPFVFMKHAKLFIHTSNHEGLPTVFIESMICGTPVVTTACPVGPTDILEQGKYGVLVPLNHPAQFVDEVYELLTHEEKRQHYISRLPEAIERFEFEGISRQLEHVLEAACQARA